MLGSVELKPIMVVEYIRHGARSPIIKIDFFKNITWANPGELTPVGQRQHYLLGRLRRQKYIGLDKLLPNKYDPNLMSLYSTNFNRTKMSLQSYMLGLYPTGFSDLNNNQTEQSKEYILPQISLTIDQNLIKDLKNHSSPYNIPVFHFKTSKITEEGLLLYESCAYGDDAIKRLYYQSGKYLKTFSEFSSTWNNLINHYHEITMEFLKTGRNAVDIADFILCAESENKRPYFVSDAMLDEMDRFIGKVMMEEFTVTPLALTISLTVATKDIVKWMDGAINETSPVKYALYSTHDSTLIILMLGMMKLDENIKLEKRPPLAGNLNFELDDEKNITIYYCGEQIYKRQYSEFRDKFLKLGDLGSSSREAECNKRA